jgi:nucleotide-binding universal stress UspA family protein
MARIRLGSVVVGVDGSPGSDDAVEWAASYSAMTRRPLLVAHALGPPDLAERIRRAAGPSRQERRMVGRRVTDHALELAHRVAPDLRVDVTTDFSEPPPLLVELSEHASLLVVSTRGHGRVTSALLGSVSATVAQEAHCAVVVVRRAPASSSRVVAGVAGDGSDKAAVEFAAELASTSGHELELVHAWGSGNPLAEKPTAEQRHALSEAHERLLVEATSGLGEKYPDVQQNRHLPEDGPVPALLRSSQDAGVLVLGSRGRSGVRSYLGSVSRSVLEHAQCTVVVARS